MQSYRSLMMFAFAVMVLGAGIGGCKDSTTPVAPSGTLTGGQVLANFAASDKVYTRDEAVAYYNRPNLCSVFWLTSEYRNDFVTGAGGTITGQFDGTDNDASATFRTSSNQGLSVGDIRLNNAILQEDIPLYGKGAYYYRKTANDSLDLVFGGGYNKIQVSANADGVPAFLDSVQFAPAIHIDGLSRGQNISKSQDLTLRWNSSGTGCWAEVKITREDGDTTRGAIGGFEFITDDDGEFTIPAATMQRLPNTITNISVRRAEPKYITLSDGRVVCVLGEPKHTVTVNIVP
ncbi:MAG TPA: hypothetical protein VHI13_11520 [Candidatus Kapabacteria bacterium]|nr:hypothetical protein [Candidatus Kapabacteria bacterium]